MLSKAYFTKISNELEECKYIIEDELFIKQEERFIYEENKWIYQPILSKPKVESPWEPVWQDSVKLHSIPHIKHLKKIDQKPIESRWDESVIKERQPEA